MLELQRTSAKRAMPKKSIVLSKELMEIYTVLRKHFGHQHWWPGDSPLEIFVGAILTQQTAWVNVEKAISNLKRMNMLDLKIMAKGGKELERAIHSSG